MSYRYPTLRDALAGYYARLDAGAAATDQFSTDGSQDGTLTNGATRVDDGGLAYSFDGTNDYITMGNVLNVTTGPLTLAAWIKPTAIAGKYIIAKYATTDTGGFVLYGNASSKLAFYINDTNGTKYHQLASVPALSTGVWTHAGATRVGAVVTEIRINGVAVSTTTVMGGTVSTLTSSHHFRIGSASNNAQYFSGLIDDVGVWNRALTNDEWGYLASQRGALYAELASEFESGMFGGMSGAMTGGMST